MESKADSIDPIKPPTRVYRYNLGDLVKFSCTLYCLHEYFADVTAVSYERASRA